MIIEKDIAKFLVLDSDTVLTAVNKINKNNSRIVFIIDNNGVLLGSFNDGDFRRWLLSNNTINMDTTVFDVCNHSFISMKVKDHHLKISGKLNEKIHHIPLVDENHRIIAVASMSNGVNQIKISSKIISETSSVFIIAEIGNNHNGSLELAKKLVDLAISSGADCAKFQMRSMKDLYGDNAFKSDFDDLGDQYTKDLLQKFQLTDKELFEVFDYCKSKDIIPLCTPWDCASIKALESYGMEAYKVASADFTNHDLLKYLIKTGKPIICSTGMSNETEILHTINFLKERGAQFSLLHCNSTYPAPFKDVNLNYINHLHSIGKCVVGYSGHERGVNIAIAAVAKGAKIIEKHFTVDQSMEGNDHKVSLLPSEFKAMVKAIRQVEASMCGTNERHMTQGELMNRETLAKSLYASKDIRLGENILENMIIVKSPGIGLQPMYKKDILGIKAIRNINKGECFFASDVQGNVVKARDYKFQHKWGIPVRFHDYKDLTAELTPDVLEFHLSYNDLNVELSDYFSDTLDLDFIVHCPELFSGDHVLDLCANDAEYREHSILELQKVIDFTRSMQPYFSGNNKTLIVTNIGGFTADSHQDIEHWKVLHSVLSDSLLKLDTKGVEIIPQTMPPFPWHFGGQSHHNLFVSIEDIVTFCQSHNYRVCLDVSHSKLACNYYGWSFHEFLTKVSPYVAHMHIADAKGVDGEGLQIGEGDMDFVMFTSIIEKKMPTASFIPEVWQGHKNNGEGFWVALDRLEDIMMHS